MNLRLALFLLAGLLFVLPEVGSIAEAKTVVNTTWEELEICEGGVGSKGGDRARIRLTRWYSDGSYEHKYMWKFCEDECECWHESPWGSVTTAPTGGLPVTVQSNGSWLLLGVTPGRGGTFVAGSGSVWNLVINPTATTIYVPVAIVGIP